MWVRYMKEKVLLHLSEKCPGISNHKDDNCVKLTCNNHCTGPTESPCTHLPHVYALTLFCVFLKLPFDCLFFWFFFPWLSRSPKPWTSCSIQLGHRDRCTWFPPPTWQTLQRLAMSHYVWRRNRFHFQDLCSDKNHISLINHFGILLINARETTCY